MYIQVILIQAIWKIFYKRLWTFTNKINSNS